MKLIDKKTADFFRVYCKQGNKKECVSVYNITHKSRGKRYLLTETDYNLINLALYHISLGINDEVEKKELRYLVMKKLRSQKIKNGKNSYVKQYEIDNYIDNNVKRIKEDYLTLGVNKRAWK